jgi:hypothetical protein
VGAAARVRRPSRRLARRRPYVAVDKPGAVESLETEHNGAEVELQLGPVEGSGGLEVVVHVAAGHDAKCENQIDLVMEGMLRIEDEAGTELAHGLALD